MRTIFYLLSLALYLSCAKSHTFQKSYAEDFDVTIFDTLKNEKGVLLSELIHNKKALLYIANNECSECISKFIDFNDIIQDSCVINDYRVIYIIYGCDKLSFDYYLERENVRINSNVHVVEDTLDIFHGEINNYYSNVLFYIDESKNVYTIQSSSHEDEWNINDIVELTK